MRAAATAAVALMLVLAGCGSSSKHEAKSTPATTGTEATLPPVESPKPKGGAKKAKGEAGKPPPVPANGETIHPGSYFAFKSPSKQIGCAYTTGPTGLRCDTAFPTRFTHRPPHCEGEYGRSFEVSPNGRSSAVCAGDTVLNASVSRTIPYGHSWTIGPYACTSQTSSLTCTNGAGHGFRLSKTQQLLF